MSELRTRPISADQADVKTCRYCGVEGSFKPVTIPPPSGQFGPAKVLYLLLSDDPEGEVVETSAGEYLKQSDANRRKDIEFHTRKVDEVAGWHAPPRYRIHSARSCDFNAKNPLDRPS